MARNLVHMTGFTDNGTEYFNGIEDLNSGEKYDVLQLLRLLEDYETLTDDDQFLTMTTLELSINDWETILDFYDQKQEGLA